MAIDVDELAQEIRRVDGKHDLGAGALAEALLPFIASRPSISEGVEASSNFLKDAAAYFKCRPTNGEDSIHWANVQNAENCLKAASTISALASRATTAEAENARLRSVLRQIVARSHNDPLGTSKVQDMRALAESALGSDGKGPRTRAALSGDQS